MSNKKKLGSRWLLGEYLLELGELLETGVTLRESIEMLARGAPDPTTEAAFGRVAENVAAGTELGAALKDAFPGLPAFCVDMLRDAQRDDALPRELARVGTYMEAMRALRPERLAVRKGFLYHAFLGVVAVMVVLFMQIFVVPQFAVLYEDFGAELPALTLLVIRISDFCLAYWWVMVLVVIVLMLAWKLPALGSRGFRRLLGAAQLRIPGMAGVYALVARIEFARTMGFLLSADVPVQRALDAVREAASSHYMRDEVQIVRDRVAAGSSLAEAMGDRRLFSGRLTVAAQVGERHGALAKLFQGAAERDTSRLGDAQGLGRLLQGLTVLLIAVAIGIVVVGMYLPIFAMGSLM